MSLRDNRFLESEKSGGIVGWAARQLAIWGGIALVVCLIVGHGVSLPARQSAAVAPPPAAVEAPDKAAQPVSNSLILRAGRDGHVYVEVYVNGEPIRMVVDTGATAVALSLRDAQKIGFSRSQLSFTGNVNTANGVARFAPIELHDMRIGQLVINDVKAAVGENLDVSLLGQTFLNRLTSYEMRDGTLTMSW